MTLALREIEGRWTSRLVLKRDSFSTVERGRFSTPAGEVEAVLRRIDQVPWWTFPIAHHLFLRERRALEIAGRLGDRKRPALTQEKSSEEQTPELQSHREIV